jgi:peptidoglycan/xylan/chitin deacetylase (PgdA/CDA1 family)
MLEALNRRGLRCSVFVPGGPDWIGLAVVRMVTQRGYLAKLLRTRAFRTYGPSAVASLFAPRARRVTQATEALHAAPASGHEIVAHGYAHTTWHNRLHHLGPGTIREHVFRSVKQIEEDLGTSPVGFGGPGWQANLASLLAVDEMGLRFASDTRGTSPFRPRLAGYELKTPQIPTTLPSLDELPGGLPPRPEAVGELYRALSSQDWPVYCAHAELEGRRYFSFFEELLSRCGELGVEIVPLSALLERYTARHDLPVCEVRQGTVPGRPGIVAVQGERAPA